MKMIKPISKNHTVKEIRLLREYRTEVYKNNPRKYFEDLKARTIELRKANTLDAMKIDLL